MLGYCTKVEATKTNSKSCKKIYILAGKRPAIRRKQKTKRIGEKKDIDFKIVKKIK